MEDEDELFHSGQCTDEESLSESEDQCLPPDKPEEIQTIHHIYVDHSKLEFFTIKFLLILSSTAIIILLPLYLEAINKSSDAYSMIYINTSFIFFILFIAIIFAKQCLKGFKNVNVLKPPVSWIKLLLLSLFYVGSAFMIIYAVDRKRVMCHLQDPIKGVILVFSLVNYFFFCKRMMGLQRIFSTTTIIVGLFISVDYGLCDEFRCRGNEREHRSDDAGVWTWQTHSVWAAVYITGLFLFATFFTLLDRFLVPVGMISPSRTSTQLLTTVSRMVAFQNSSPQLRTITTNSSNKKQTSCLLLAFYLQTAAWILSTLLFWTDIIPTLGKVTIF
ncbi:hypothetical protein MML48_3g00004332 [Holotrichia oblita]|uniref:Uncharacterized protein n=1 Tax=Holotrichia oblita TaxID=644536 RepID=A0ACB9THL8_HOLOL|nr:hypothetical protein MML48_3g00004332 [Holotrichia oblita]